MIAVRKQQAAEAAGAAGAAGSAAGAARATEAGAAGTAAGAARATGAAEAGEAGMAGSTGVAGISPADPEATMAGYLTEAADAQSQLVLQTQLALPPKPVPAPPPLHKLPPKIPGTSKRTRERLAKRLQMIRNCTAALPWERPPASSVAAVAKVPGTVKAKAADAAKAHDLADDIFAWPHSF